MGIPIEGVRSDRQENFARAAVVELTMLGRQPRPWGAAAPPALGPLPIPAPGHTRPTKSGTAARALAGSFTSSPWVEWKRSTLSHSDAVRGLPGPERGGAPCARARVRVR